MKPPASLFRTLSCAACASGLLALVTNVHAQQAVSASGPASQTSSAGSMLMVGLMLVAMIAGAWYLKRGGRLKGAPASELRVVSAVAVGARERIAIVEVAGKRLVVGITAQQISLLAETAAPAAFSASFKQAQETRDA
jgi:flagellar protein FliO/FliZ